MRAERNTVSCWHSVCLVGHQNKSDKRASKTIGLTRAYSQPGGGGVVTCRLELPRIPCVGTRAKNDKRLQTVPSIRSETLVDTNVGRWSPLVPTPNPPGCTHFVSFGSLLLFSAPSGLLSAHIPEAGVGALWSALEPNPQEHLWGSVSTSGMGQSHWATLSLFYSCWKIIPASQTSYQRASRDRGRANARF